MHTYAKLFDEFCVAFLETILFSLIFANQISLFDSTGTLKLKLIDLSQHIDCFVQQHALWFTVFCCKYSTNNSLFIYSFWIFFLFHFSIKLVRLSVVLCLRLCSNEFIEWYEVMKFDIWFGLIQSTVERKLLSNNIGCISACLKRESVNGWRWVIWWKNRESENKF